MKFRTFLVFFALVASVGVGHASVTYEWTNLTTVPGDQGRDAGFSGQLTFDDATVAAGFLNVSSSASAIHTFVPHSGTPIYYSYFGVESIRLLGTGGGGVVRNCAGLNVTSPSVAPDCSLLGGLVFGSFFPSQSSFTFDIAFGPFLSGSLSYLGFAGEVNMASGSGSIWTTSRFRSDDAGLNCFQASTTCAGITGLWMRVPEPSCISLIGLGVVAVSIARRRKPQQSPSPTGSSV